MTTHKDVTELTPSDISLEIVHGASGAALWGSGVPIPRKYVAKCIREYRAAGVSNWVLEGALINMRFTALRS